MQRLQSLFRRPQAVARTAAAPAGKPTPLSLDALKFVAGGLPRVGRIVAQTDSVVVEGALPRVG